MWQAVLARPADERAAAIVELSAGDDALRRDVEALLEITRRASREARRRGLTKEKLAQLLDDR